MTKRILNSFILAVVAGLSMGLFSGWIKSNYDRGLFITENPPGAPPDEPDSIYPADSTTMPGIKSVQ